MTARRATTRIDSQQRIAVDRVDLSVVIPAYRSEDTLRPLVDRLLPVLDGLGGRSEVIFVEDGSPDRAWEVLRQLQEEHPDRIVAVQLMRNYGQHNALMCGFRHAKGRRVVTMDDDLQHAPEAIPSLLRALDEDDLDLVYGAYGTKRHLPWRNLGSSAVNGFYRTVFGTSVTVTSFRAIRRELLQSILYYDLNFTYIDGLLAWNTRRMGEVGVEHHERASGRSGYSIGKLLGLALNLFTNFSLIPLQWASVVGVVTAFGGLLVGAYYLLQALRSNISVPGYASIIIAVLVLGGIQLLSLGIMGEYLGRLHLNVNRKPQYVERTLLGARSPDREAPQSVPPDRTAAVGDALGAPDDALSETGRA